MNTVADRARELIAAHLGRDVAEVTPDKMLIADLGADSLDEIEILMSVEDVFSIAVPDEAWSSPLSVADVLRLIETAGAVPAKPST
jgi:acyl carrier protein